MGNRCFWCGADLDVWAEQGLGEHKHFPLQALKDAVAKAQLAQTMFHIRMVDLITAVKEKEE